MPKSWNLEQVKEIHLEAITEAGRVAREYEANNHWYPCGRAYIHFSKANSSFVNKLKSMEIGRKAYGGGYDVPAFIFIATQSMEAQAAGCRAYESVLKANGVDDSFFTTTQID